MTISPFPSFFRAAGATTFSEIFIIEDTGSDSAVSFTSEADRGLTGTPTAQGAWVGQWSSPELTAPSNGLYILGYSDYLRTNAIQRAGAICQFSLNTGGGHANVGMSGATSWGYNRFSGGANYSARHGIYTTLLAEDDIVKVREGTQLNSSDRVGTYNRTAGDPRGMWALNLGTTQDYLFASISSSDTGSGYYGNAVIPIDLGTPDTLTGGTWADVTFDTTEDSNGSTITRSGSVFTVAANSIVLCQLNYQSLDGSGIRRNLLMRMDIDGSPYAYSTIYYRNTANEGQVGSIVMPIITGGSSVEVTFKFVNQVEDTGSYISIQDASVSFIELTGQDICLLGKTDTDITTITTTQQVSFPAGDEIQVDSASFDHPVGNLTRITNDSGEEITVLAGFTVLCDRSATTSGNRKNPMSVIRQNGTQIDYAVAGEYSRGNQGDQDCFVAGYSYCAPVVLGSSDYLELDIFDESHATGSDLIVNCTDDKAIYFWAIRVDS